MRTDVGASAALLLEHRGGHRGHQVGGGEIHPFQYGVHERADLGPARGGGPGRRYRPQGGLLGVHLDRRAHPHGTGRRWAEFTGPADLTGRADLTGPADLTGRAELTGPAELT